MHWRNPLAFSLCYDAISYKSNSYMSPQPQTRKGSADKQKRSLHTYFCSKGEVRIFMLFSFSYLWNGRKDYCVWSKDQDLLWLWKSYLFIPFCIAFFFCGEKSCQDLLSDCINFRTFQSKMNINSRKHIFKLIHYLSQLWNLNGYSYQTTTHLKQSDLNLTFCPITAYFPLYGEGHFKRANDTLPNNFYLLEFPLSSHWKAVILYVIISHCTTPMIPPSPLSWQ